MANEQPTGRKMDDAWRRAISEGMKRGSAAVDAVSSAASSVKGGLVEKATALKSEIAAKAPGAISAARSTLRSGLENAKVRGTAAGAAIKSAATLGAAKVAYGKGFNKTAMNAIGEKKTRAGIAPAIKQRASAAVGAAKTSVMEAVKQKGKSSAIATSERSRRASAGKRSAENAAAAEKAAPVATAAKKVKDFFTRDSSSTAAEKMRKRTMGQ